MAEGPHILWGKDVALIEAEIAMAELYATTIRQLEGQLERARRVAVLLEQEVAALTPVAPVETRFPCAWCDEPSQGMAYQFSDSTYPERSCGVHGHHFVKDGGRS